MTRRRTAIASICIVFVFIAVIALVLPEGPDSRRPFVADKRTFFHMCGCGTAGRVESMLKLDPSLLTARDTHGETPLHYAALGGNLATLDVLIRHGVLVDATDGMRQTPLLYAVLQRHTNVAQRLVTAGADVNLADNDSIAPLHMAVMRHHFQMVQLLVRSGANVNASQTTDGCTTPLSMAETYGEKAIAAYLRQHGAKQAHTPP